MTAGAKYFPYVWGGKGKKGDFTVFRGPAFAQDFSVYRFVPVPLILWKSVQF